MQVWDTFLGRRGFFKKLARAADAVQHSLNEEEVFRLAQLSERPFVGTNSSGFPQAFELHELFPFISTPSARNS